jgi:DNA transposition AAA+ family ATPase
MNTLDIIEAIKAAVKSGKTYAAIAKECDMSTSALSQFIKGAYTGDNDKLANKLIIWLDNQKAQKVVVVPDFVEFVETETVRKIWSALNYAQVAGCFAVVYGNSGVGKTGALTKYAERPNCWLVTVRPSSSSLSEFLFDIAACLELSHLVKRAGTLSRAIIEKLRKTKGLLIIDESDHLPYEALEEIRLIQEMSGVGVVLCGNHQIYAKLSGGGSRKTDFARLFSRVAKKVSILKTSDADIDTICDAWNLTGERERKLVHKIGQKAGALRTIRTTLSLSAILASGQNSSIKEQHIKAAICDLEGN